MMSIAVANIIATPFLTVNTDIASVQASTFKEKKNTEYKVQAGIKVFQVGQIGR